MSKAIALPQALASLSGRLTDVDTHEMIPAQLWVEYFGSDVKELADAMLMSPPDDKDKNSSNVPNFLGDVSEITEKVVDMKGSRAPGAVDMNRRLQVMDAMGVQRILMYPTSVGLWAIILMMNDKYDPHVMESIQGDRIGKAKNWLKSYNRWMMTQANDRVRPVPPLIGVTVEELMTNAREMLDNGIRAVMLAAGALPGGKSPAHPDLDPFWAMLAEAKCAVTLHVGTEGKYLESLRGWRDAPVFDGYRSVAEFSTDPWYMSSMHLAGQNFLVTMVQGGVFARHPTLRMGVTELGAYWIKPMMDAMDLWHKNMSAFAPFGKGLKKLPSEYVKSNVKVSVFSFEDLEAYIERDGLEDVICFASDYPHVEGGRDMINVMHKKIERFGPEVVEKFFVTNGAFLLPD